MSYVATGFSPEQREALEVSAEELRSLPVETRADYMIRHREVRAAERSAFWDALATALPVAAALGLGALLGKGKK